MKITSPRGDNMTKEQYKFELEPVVKSLSDFIIRTAKKETATESELQALPATVSALNELLKTWVFN